MSVWVNAIEAARIAVKMPIAATTTIVSWAWANRGFDARDEVDAGVDHRRRVDQGRDRGRALHRVRQPDVERELGALAHGAREHEQRDDADRDRRAGRRAPVSLAIESWMLSVPVLTKIAMIPSANPTSPTRLTMNAFFAASAAERFVYQKPISE